MALFRRSSGAWSAVTPGTSSGNTNRVHIRSGASWKNVGRVYIRQNGQWKLGVAIPPGIPGYVDPLSNPSNVDDFGTIDLQWLAPTTGGPVSGYQVAMFSYDANRGNKTQVGATRSLPSTTLATSFSVSQDTYYSFEIRAVGVDPSDLSPIRAVQYLTGHPEVIVYDVPHYEWVYRYWSNLFNPYWYGTVETGGLVEQSDHPVWHATDNNDGTEWIAGTLKSGLAVVTNADGYGNSFGYLNEAYGANYVIRTGAGNNTRHRFRTVQLKFYGEYFWSTFGGNVYFDSTTAAELNGVTSDNGRYPLGGWASGTPSRAGTNDWVMNTTIGGFGYITWNFGEVDTCIIDQPAGLVGMSFNFQSQFVPYLRSLTGDHAWAPTIREVAVEYDTWTLTRYDPRVSVSLQHNSNW